MLNYKDFFRVNKDKVVAILDRLIVYALYAMLFCIPLSKSLIEVTFMIAFLAWVLKKILLKDFKLKYTSLNLALFLFLCSNIISILNSPYFFLSLRSLFSKIINYILLFFIIIETIDSEEKLKNILKIGLFSIIVVTSDAFIQYYVSHYDLFRFYASFKYRFDFFEPSFPGFPTGPFPFPNDLSAWMLIFMMPLLSVFVWSKKSFGIRLLIGCVLAAFLHLFYLANTRSAWLGFFASFFLLIFLKQRRILIVIIILVLFIMPLLPQDRIYDIVGLSSMKDRISIWRTGFDIFMKHPIIGNGINTFFELFKQTRADNFKGLKGSYAHNGYLQIAADTGIIGLVCFIFIIIMTLRTAFAVSYSTMSSFKYSLHLGLGLGTLAFLIHSFFDTNLQSLPLITLFWYNTGFVFCISSIKNV